MPEYQVSDVVICKILDRTIVPTEAFVWDDTVSVEIVYEMENGYIVFVPSSAALRGGFIYDASMQRRYSYIDKRFRDSNMTIITDADIWKLKHRYCGAVCDNCKEFYDMAATNAETGKFICFACRVNKYR